MKEAVQSRGRRVSPLDALVNLVHKKHKGSKAEEEADAEDGTEKYYDEWNDEWHHEWQPGYGAFYDDNGTEIYCPSLEAETKHKQNGGSALSKKDKRKARKLKKKPTGAEPVQGDAKQTANTPCLI
jgi:hypothetical protein